MYLATVRADRGKSAARALPGHVVVPTGDSRRTFAVTEPWAWHPALQYDQLLTQAQILDDQVRSGFRPRCDRSPRPPDHADPPSHPRPAGSLSHGLAEGKDGGSSSCALQGSMPQASPPAPAAVPATMASRPGPQPTSRIRSPGRIPASSTILRWRAASCPKDRSVVPRGRRGGPSGSSSLPCGVRRSASPDRPRTRRHPRLSRTTRVVTAYHRCLPTVLGQAVVSRESRPRC
jgi:hypothetical protein